MLVIFSAGLLWSALFGLVAIRWIGPLGFMDLPRGRRQHMAPTPKVGGLVLIMGLALADLLTGIEVFLDAYEWSALLSMAIMGVLDDLFDWRARWKAALGLSIAFGLAWHESTWLLSSGRSFILLGHSLLQERWAYMGLLVPLFWGIPNAMNLIDGMNGVCIGYAAIVAGILAGAGGAPVLLVGMLTGVLLLNYPQARLFLGDAGSLTLGLLLALLVMKKMAFTDPNRILLLFAYPIADVSMVVMIRLLLGRRVWEGDRNHLHHQWEILLNGRRCWVAPILWLVSLLVGLGALGNSFSPMCAGLGLWLLGLQALGFIILAVGRKQLSDLKSWTQR